jgi:5'-phosphate synthase pdxT subunit
LKLHTGADNAPVIDLMKIGVLALQGDFEEHIAALRRIGAEAHEVRLPEQLEGLDGLIIPGGESTTIGKLAEDYRLLEPLRKFGREKAIWGTCAGAIFLSKDANRPQPLLGLMDIHVERNAFGRQVASFETDLDVPALAEVNGGAGDGGRRYHAVFIRAPLIESVEGDAQVLAALEDGRIVAARQGKLLATSFHPELTGDDRFHRYFLHLAAGGAEFAGSG